MLYVFGFNRLSVALGDLFFSDPNPLPGSEGAERGVRLEVRFLEEHELPDTTVYASRSIVVGEPIWRVDLLETTTEPGSLNRAHHHPRMREWEPGFRKFEPEITADPVNWLAGRLDDMQVVLTEAEIDVDDALASDVLAIRAAAPEILDAARKLLKGVGNGELGQAPPSADDDVAAGVLVRAGWL
jgi:hypothetical protein